MIRGLGVEARTVGQPEQADIILALRSRGDDLRLQRTLQESHARLHLIKRNTANEIRRLLQHLFNVQEGVAQDEAEEARSEAEAGIEQAIQNGVDVALPPRPSQLRRMQHRIIAGSGLVAESAGKEPHRHLVIFPPEAEE